MDQAQGQQQTASDQQSGSAEPLICVYADQQGYRVEIDADASADAANPSAPDTDDDSGPGQVVMAKSPAEVAAIVRQALSQSSAPQRPNTPQAAQASDAAYTQGFAQAAGSQQTP